jgi:hypothetical protein
MRGQIVISHAKPHFGEVISTVSWKIAEQAVSRLDSNQPNSGALRSARHTCSELA